MQRFFPTGPRPKKLLELVRAGIGAEILTACALGCTKPRIPARKAVVMVESEPRHLDPLHATDAVSQKIDNLIHGALVRFSPRMELEGELAESWTHTGYRVFKFRLRPGLKFQDGSMLSADEVVRALRMYDSSSPLGVALAHVTRITAVDPRTVRLETDSAQPFLLEDLPVLKIFKRDGERIVGAGRYQLVSVSRGLVRVRAAGTYFEPLAPGALEEIEFRYIADDTTRYQHLIRGDANVMINALSMPKTAYLRSHAGDIAPDIRVVDSPGINYSYLCFNLRDPRLSKLKVRQAIAHAIDKANLIRYRIGSLGYPATGILAPAHAAYYEPSVVRYPYDTAVAERLLDEAGFPRKGPGGWRFELSFKTTTDKYGSDMAHLLANELRRVGIDARLDVVEAGTFFSQINRGNFQVFHSRWVGVTSPSIFFRVFHSSQIGNKGLNRGAYSNPEMDRLLNAGMREVNDRRRREIFSKVQKLAAEDLPYVSLWHWNNTFIGTADMTNVVMYPNGDYRTLADVRVNLAGKGKP